MPARLPDLQTLIAAGIDPKTGLPIKAVGSQPCVLKENIKKLLRIVDEQDALNRYTWHGLPDEIDGNLVERMLYYKGQAAFFYEKTLDRFFILPYALDGTIDVYGRFTGIKPLPFNGSTESDNKTAKKDPQTEWLSGLHRIPIYDIVITDMDMEKFETYCVLLSDYSKQISQTVLPRQMLNDPLLDVESEFIPYMRLAAISSTGVQGMRVQDEDAESNVEAASQSVQKAALSGRKWIPIIGTIDFQELTGNPTYKTEDYMLAMESLDNLRLGLYGLQNGGLFQKRAHMLQAEQSMMSAATGLILQDGLYLRQKFCDIVNSIWGIGIWCEISENAAEADLNMDGVMMDEQDQSGMIPGDNSPEEAGEILGD